MKYGWKKVLAFGLVGVGNVLAQLQPGDVAITGFDGDGTDAISFVALKEIPAHTELRFSDAPWDGAAFHPTKEGEFVWNAGAAAVAAGTVVTISDIGDNGTYAPSVGEVTAIKKGGLGSAGENVFVFLGSASRTPSTFLAAFANKAGELSSLLGTGLSDGYTSLLMATSTGSQYKGPRTGLDARGFLLALGDTANWDNGLTELSATPVNFVVDADNAAPVVPKVAFAKDFSVTPDNAGSATVTLALSAATTIPVSVDVRFQDLGSAVNNTNMQVVEKRVTFAPGSTTAEFVVPVLEKTVETRDLYYALTIVNAADADIGSLKRHVAYIRKPAISAPVAADNLQMEWLSSYTIGNGGTAEIVGYHAEKKRLYVLNSTESRVDILNFADPEKIVPVSSLDMSAYGLGATSVAVFGDLIAATVDAGPEANGKVVLLDPDGQELKVLEVGNLPDMVTFSHDGKWLLTANEGQPKSDYTIDAEGSVSLIDLSEGVATLDQSKVTTVGFADFNGQKDALVAEGLRVFGVHNGASTLAEDVEPEYITVSADNKVAWVTLQENNAIAVLDLETKKIGAIHPLGYKDHSLPGNELDASDKTGEPLLANWPVFGIYMPDAIANYTVDGVTYLVTANEGDSREYSALTEDVRVSKLKLDPAVFPNAAFLQSDKAMGRLSVVGCHGLVSSVDVDVDNLCVMGGRSFSIWNASTGERVYDSGSDFERITATDPVFGALFNSNHESNSPKDRSDNKGPEPEGVTIGKVGDKTYAFITLERTGGVMAYDITNPLAPVFEKYVNSRSVDVYGGDHGPEGVLFIPAEKSPTLQAMVLSANEVSASIAVYSLADTYTPPTDPTDPTNPTDPTDPVDPGDVTTVLATPATVQWQRVGDVVYFSHPVDVRLLDARGSQVLQKSAAAWVDLGDLPRGAYGLVVAGRVAGSVSLH